MSHLGGVQAQKFEPNYDEAKVPEYTLPDPLIFENGDRVLSAEDWTAKRRPEVFSLFEEHVYGKTPKDFFDTMKFETLSEGSALDGKAKRREVRLRFFKDGKELGHWDILTYVPSKATPTQKVPGIVSLNFLGNHTVSDDPDILLETGWDTKNNQRVARPAKAEERGLQKSRWPVEMMIDRNFALLTACYHQLEPDGSEGYQEGIRKHLPERKENDWGSIGVWAWGLSRILDYVEKDGIDGKVDPKRIMVVGHSRLGKTALWAGASDQRFYMVVSNDSGCGGAALSRREFGETVKRINTVFPHWFAKKFRQYDDCVADCPVDQHELVALAAPRKVYVASATSDLWADPKGEFLAAFHADPVYRLLATDGFGNVKEMPEPDQPVGRTIGYHLRTGKHDITAYDWEQYFNAFERN